MDCICVEQYSGQSLTSHKPQLVAEFAPEIIDKFVGNNRVLNVKNSHGAMQISKARKIDTDGESNLKPRVALREPTCMPPTGNSKSRSITFSMQANTTMYSYLGYSITSGDLNYDGYVDLIVGAPGYGSNGRAQQGAVYVILGTKPTAAAANSVTLPVGSRYSSQSTFAAGSSPFVLPMPPSSNAIRGSVLEFGQAHDRFGSATAILDFNTDGWLDLAVSAPNTGAHDLVYYGAVYVYFGNGTGYFAYVITIPPQRRIDDISTHSLAIAWHLATACCRQREALYRT
jgi:hypothetical protein